MPRIDLNNCAGIAGGICVLLLAFAVVGGIDYEEAKRQEVLRQARAVDLAAGTCLPRPGQRTVWEWTGEGDDARLRCVIFAPISEGSRPTVAIMEATPAGLDRLALFGGSR